eukprot:11167619-Lingulodinium_polyedra.AAC.1
MNSWAKLRLHQAGRRPPRPLNSRALSSAAAACRRRRPRSPSSAWMPPPDDCWKEISESSHP